MKPELKGDFDCARGFSGQSPKRIEEMKAWALSRGRIFLEDLEASDDAFEIEGALYLLKRVFEHAFDEAHSVNRFGDVP